jgi:hypothetical protein
MSERGTPYFHRTMELLADGEWHDMALILIKAMESVEPSKAIRRCEKDRRNAYGKDENGEPIPKPRVKPRTLQEQQEIGARAIITDMFAHNRRFEVQWLDDNKQWRTKYDRTLRQSRRRVRLDPNYVYGSPANQAGTSQGVDSTHGLSAKEPVRPAEPVDCVVQQLDVDADGRSDQDRQGVA